MNTFLKYDIKTSILFITGCGIIGIMLWKIGLGNFYKVLLTLDPLLFLASFLLTLASIAIKLIRWVILFKYARVIDTFKIYFVGQGINQIGPFGSGELARAYIANKKLGVPTGKTLISAAIERISDTIFLSIMAVIGVILLIPGNTSLQLGILVFFITIFCVILARPELISKLAWVLDRFTEKREGFLGIFTKKVSNLLREFSDTLSLFGKQRLLLGTTFFLTIGAWVANALAIYTLFLNFSTNSTILYLLVIASMSEIAGVILPIPGGLGTKDASFAMLLSLVEVPFETGIVIYLVYRGVVYLLLGSGVFMSMLSFSKK